MSFLITICVGESSKLNSNAFHYKLKFISTSKQKYNSKFQEFETVRTIEIRKTTKFGPTKFLKINDYEKPIKNNHNFNNYSI